MGPEHVHAHAQSRDTHETITAHPNAQVVSNRFSFPKEPRELIYATLLALSIAVNIWCAYTIRDIGTRKWLHDYDLQQFRDHEFADLRNNVEVTKLLMATQCGKPKQEK